VYFRLLTRSIYYTASNISCSSSRDMEAFHINKTLGKVRAKEDTSLPQGNGHKRYPCVTNRFAVCSKFVHSAQITSFLIPYITALTERQEYSLLLHKKSQCWNSIVDYSKDTLYKKTEWDTSKGHRTVYHWMRSRDCNVWREYTVREKYALTYLTVLYSSFQVPSS
jgi:hypothetical protein